MGGDKPEAVRSTPESWGLEDRKDQHGSTAALPNHHHHHHHYISVRKSLKTRDQLELQIVFGIKK
jgi:hypothetical protein